MVVVVSVLLVVTVAVIGGRTKVMAWGATGPTEPRPHDNCAEVPESKPAGATAETKSNIIPIAVDLSEMKRVKIEVRWKCLLRMLPRASSFSFKAKKMSTAVGPRNKIPQENEKKLHRGPG